MGDKMKNINSVDSVTTFQIEMLSIRMNNRWDWAKVCFDDETGLLQIHSSFGTYAYCWSHRGDKSLKEFFIKADKYYLSNKLWKNSFPETESFQSHYAFEDVTKRLFKLRREWDIDAEYAREVYNELQNIKADLDDSHFSYEAFMNAWFASEILCDYEHQYGFRPIGRFLTLRDELVPMIQEQFKRLLNESKNER